MTALRSPDTVMRLARMGASHPTRLSFMRVLLRGLADGGWTADRPLWEVDGDGVGRAVYRVRGQGQTYSLVAFAHDLPDELRSDRVIAEAWDATFALVDGEPSAEDLDRLAANVPKQEAGRVSDRELVLSRANRSGRLWAHVVDRLAEGRQPDAALIDEVGYLMRTTAVYGSGKFGAADHEALKGRALMDGPFRAEMLAVWLIRAFVADLAEHVARVRGGAGAARLDPALRRSLGIGNATGLGMAPFLVNHPDLLHAWIAARETALGRVRDLPVASADSRAAFSRALAGAQEAALRWRTRDPVQAAKWDGLRRDMARLSSHVADGALAGAAPWDALWRWAEDSLGLEGQEMCLSLMLEPHGELVDDLADTMGADEIAGFAIDGAIPLSLLREMLSDGFGWALGTDYAAAEASARFWYVSEAKLEPRLGERYAEPGAELEQPLDIARAAAALKRDLDGAGEASVAGFLAAYPRHRRIVRRVQALDRAPYREIRDNLLSADMRPIDMLRCKLAFFGATNFDPRSDRWLRITMYQGAPYPDELHAIPADGWLHHAGARLAEAAE
ncbi:hypothetical protein N8I71_11220 [Roseibacterium sp. SDUM158016]|uniref:hypothetical protein n=1 Tax=Roseicyclus sediminis TaxID=2980997 RepID=UPI0021D0C170|nr:hypothetical protein [Roseibacterium sp. SDUM158016]MCU4653407.1 hypothetical protein [Roseibacterium sp. SDUM158016]